MSDKLTDIRFVPITQEPFRGMVGYIDFSLNSDLLFKDMAVYERKDTKGFRVVYRKNDTSGREYVKPQNKRIQQFIDDEVTKFLKERDYGRTTSNVDRK